MARNMPQSHASYHLSLAVLAVLVADLDADKRKPLRAQKEQQVMITVYLRVSGLALEVSETPTMAART